MTIYQVKVDNAYLNPEYTDEVGFFIQPIKKPLKHCKSI